MKKIITGTWDGETIWRYETVYEQLMKEIEKNRVERLQREAVQVYDVPLLQSGGGVVRE